MPGLVHTIRGGYRVMAKIPLRSSIREIERLIDSGGAEQAVSVSKFILLTHPKYVDAYRLLGKAFLELQRNSEAVDVLQRVLSSIPDDFISHIGMSIIRESESQIDGAIWHMERAYEVQPSSPAIQDELRRLIGKRDGSEPPKVRLTRGGMVRMYMKGDLAPQAIAEIRAGLPEEQNRPDMQVLLARLYLQTGRLNEAVEVCEQLLKQLPYCYDANRVLAEIFISSGRVNDAEPYRGRLVEMDPYLGALTINAPLTTKVPDEAVLIDEYTPNEADAAPLRFSQPIQPEENEPETVSGGMTKILEGEPPSQPSLPAQQQVEAHQAEPASVDQGQPAVASSSSDIKAGQTAEDSEIPEWIKEAGLFAKPSQTVEQDEKIIETKKAAAPAGEMSFDEEIPEWMQSLTASSAPGSADFPPLDLSKIKSSPGPFVELEKTQPSGAQIPEQANGPASNKPAVFSDVPDVAEIFQPENPSAQSSPFVGFSAEDTSSLESVPVLQDPGLAPETVGAEVPDWMHGFRPQESTSPPPDQVRTSPLNFPSGQDQAQSPPEEGLPDWLRGGAAAKGENPATDIKQATGVQPQEQAPEWLTTPQSASIEPKPIDPGLQQTGTVPDWMKGSSTRLEDTAPTVIRRPPETRMPAEWIQEPSNDEVPNLIIEKQEDHVEPSVQPAAQPESVEDDLRSAFVLPQSSPSSSRENPDARAIASLEDARNSITSGNMRSGLRYYTDMLHEGKAIESIVSDLEAMLFENPSDFLFWRTLGDGYVRTNKVQDALIAYTKAEEILLTRY